MRENGVESGRPGGRVLGTRGRTEIGVRRGSRVEAAGGVPGARAASALTRPPSPGVGPGRSRPASTRRVAPWTVSAGGGVLVRGAAGPQGGTRRGSSGEDRAGTPVHHSSAGPTPGGSEPSAGHRQAVAPQRQWSTWRRREAKKPRSQRLSTVPPSVLAEAPTPAHAEGCCGVTEPDLSAALDGCVAHRARRGPPVSTSPPRAPAPTGSPPPRGHAATPRSSR